MEQTWWQEVRGKVREKRLAPDIAYSIFDKLLTTNCHYLLAIRPAYHFGFLYNLIVDYLKLVDLIIGEVEEGDKNKLISLLLYLQSACENIMEEINKFSPHLTHLIERVFVLYNEREAEKKEKASDTEMIAERGLSEEEEEEPEDFSFDMDSEKLREDLYEEKDKLAELLTSRFMWTNAPSEIINITANRIAEIYLEGIQFLRNLKRIINVSENDIETIMVALIDLSYGLEWKFRYLISNDIVSDEGFKFTPGILTWSSLLLTELTNIE